MQAHRHDAADTTAVLMLVALSCAWGTTWLAMRIALDEIPPFSMRVLSLGLGAAALFIFVKLQRRRFTPGGMKNFLHLVVSGVLNVLSFSLFSTIAMLYAATGRVAMLCYTMPIWAAVLAWAVLGERFTRMLVIALVLCIVGMAVLLWPLAQHGAPIGPLIAIGIAVSWAFGTVYVKWARITGDPVANSAWQILISFVIVALCLPFFEGSLRLAHAHLPALLATVFAGLVGSGLAYYLWFGIIGRIPAMTASLGVLSAPVIGTAATALFLGEWPTVPDMIGFAMIFAASVCALLPSREPVAPEPS